jgi:hypothetical protein
MKKFISILILSSIFLFATDYSSMSIDELANMRGNIPTEDRDAFKNAWQSKTQYLSPEEKISYMEAKRTGSENGKGTMTRQRLKDGSGGGNMYKGSRGKNGMK